MRTLQASLQSGLLLCTGLLLGACQAEQTSDDLAATADETTTEAKAKAKTCRPTSFTFVSSSMVKGEWVEQKKTMLFKYDDQGRLTNSVAAGSETEEAGIATYTYDDKSRLLSSEIPKSEANQNKGLKATFVYTEDGKLSEITGEGALNTRTFEHGEDGRITGQVTMFNGKPYVSLVFEYDDAGAPVKMSMFNTKGDLQNGYELAYDDKVNPFAGMVFANVTSLILGHPVGAYKHNLVSRKKFNARTTEPAPAQVTTYTYNDAGYPLTIAQADKPDEVPASLEYDCQ